MHRRHGDVEGLSDPREVLDRTVDYLRSEVVVLISYRETGIPDYVKQSLRGTARIVEGYHSIVASEHLLRAGSLVVLTPYEYDYLMEYSVEREPRLEGVRRRIGRAPVIVGYLDPNRPDIKRLVESVVRFYIDRILRRPLPEKTIRKIVKNSFREKVEIFSEYANFNYVSLVPIYWLDVVLRRTIQPVQKSKAKKVLRVIQEAIQPFGQDIVSAAAVQLINKLLGRIASDPFNPELAVSLRMLPSYMVDYLERNLRVEPGTLRGEATSLHHTVAEVSRYFEARISVLERLVESRLRSGAGRVLHVVGFESFREMVEFLGYSVLETDVLLGFIDRVKGEYTGLAEELGLSSIAITAPTGTGKTFMALVLARLAMDSGVTVYVACPYSNCHPRARSVSVEDLEGSLVLYDDLDDDNYSLNLLAEAVKTGETRPSFILTARPTVLEKLYDRLIREIAEGEYGNLSLADLRRFTRGGVTGVKYPGNLEELVREYAGMQGVELGDSVEELIEGLRLTYTVSLGGETLSMEAVGLYYMVKLLEEGRIHAGPARSGLYELEAREVLEALGLAEVDPYRLYLDIAPGLPVRQAGPAGQCKGLGDDPLYTVSGCLLYYLVPRIILATSGGELPVKIYGMVKRLSRNIFLSRARERPRFDSHLEIVEQSGTATFPHESYSILFSYNPEDAEAKEAKKTEGWTKLLTLADLLDLTPIQLHPANISLATLLQAGSTPGREKLAHGCALLHLSLLNTGHRSSYTKRCALKALEYDTPAGYELALRIASELDETDVREIIDVARRGGKWASRALASIATSNPLLLGNDPVETLLDSVAKGEEWAASALIALAETHPDLYRTGHIDKILDTVMKVPGIGVLLADLSWYKSEAFTRDHLERLINIAARSDETGTWASIAILNLAAYRRDLFDQATIERLVRLVREGSPWLRGLCLLLDVEGCGGPLVSSVRSILSRDDIDYVLSMARKGVPGSAIIVSIASEKSPGSFDSTHISEIIDTLQERGDEKEPLLIALANLAVLNPGIFKQNHITMLVRLAENDPGIREWVSAIIFDLTSARGVEWLDNETRRIICKITCWSPWLESLARLLCSGG